MTDTTNSKQVKHQDNSPKKGGVVRSEDGTIELTIVIPWNEAKLAQEKVESDLSKNVKIAGFRPGQAPRSVSRTKLDLEVVREETLKKVVGNAYNDAVKKHNLNPIISPQIHIEVFTDGTDIVFTAKTCEEPIVELGNYRDEVKKITAKSKIIVPGRENEKTSLDSILEATLKSSNALIPEILVENETSRLLSQLLDELKKLGLSLDQYLTSKGLDAEKLKVEYKTKAEQDLKLEFLLRKVADQEKITVEKEDIEKALTSIENQAERAEVMKNPYLVASIIRQQKTVTFLSSL